MKLHFPIILLICLCFSACIVIDSPSKRTYDNLEDAQKSKVVFNQQELCKQKNKQLIYAVNAEQLKSCLAQYPKSIIYTWLPRCKSDFCVPLSFFVNQCVEKGYHPVVITDYLLFPEILDMNNTEEPVFVADNKYYNIQKPRTLKDQFIFDLIQRKPKNNKDTLSWYRYYMFEKEKFVKVIRDIKNL